MPLATRPALTAVGLAACALALLASGTAHATPTAPSTATDQGRATDVLKYGDKVHIQNGFSSWAGGYLDTNGGSTAQGAAFGVSTADGPTRSVGTGTWELTSATGKAAGTQILSGDLIHLRNLWGNDGGYLDISGGATTATQTASAMYDVSTHKNKDRVGAGTGSWRIYAQTSPTADRAVRENDVVLLWNAYQNENGGGFLETNGASTATSEGKYDVCTNAYWDRAGGTGQWRLQKASA